MADLTICILKFLVININYVNFAVNTFFWTSGLIDFKVSSFSTEMKRLLEVFRFNLKNKQLLRLFLRFRFIWLTMEADYERF